MLMSIMRARMPSALSSSSSSSIAPRSPEAAHHRGPLSPPTSSLPSQRSRRRSSSSAAIEIDAIAPCEGIAAWTRARSTARRALSSSEVAPATYAAAISPTLCPITAPGSTPNERQVSARETVTAQSAGWTRSIRCHDSWSASARSTSRSCQSTCGASAAAQASIRSRNTSEVSISSSPMPAHCDPCPGKTKTGRSELPALPEIRLTAGAPCARASRPADSSSRLAARTAALCSWAGERAASERARSASPRPGEEPIHRDSRFASSRRAPSLGADSTRGTAVATPARALRELAQRQGRAQVGSVVITPPPPRSLVACPPVAADRANRASTSTSRPSRASKPGEQRA